MKNYYAIQNTFTGEYRIGSQGTNKQDVLDFAVLLGRDLLISGRSSYGLSAKEIRGLSKADVLGTIGWEVVEVSDTVYSSLNTLSNNPLVVSAWV